MVITAQSPPRSHSDTRTLTHTHMHTHAHAAHSHTCGPGGLEARLASLPNWIPSAYSSSLGRRICRQAFWEAALSKPPNQGDPLLPASHPVLPSGTETGQKGPQRGLLLPSSILLPPSLPSLPSPHPGVRGPRASPQVRGGRRHCSGDWLDPALSQALPGEPSVAPHQSWGAEGAVLGKQDPVKWVPMNCGLT